MYRRTCKEICLSVERDIERLQRNIDELKETFRDNDYHIREISNHVAEIKRHFDTINESVGGRAMNVEDVAKTNNLPGEVIQEKIRNVERKSNFDGKNLRKTSSLKYLAKWENILHEQWHQQNKPNEEYDYSGVNIVVPKRIQQFDGQRAKKRTSSNNDRFVDQTLTKCSSIGCIPESNQEKEEDGPIRKFNSAGNILDVMDDGLYESDYLLSLNDLEMIGKTMAGSTDKKTTNEDGKINEEKEENKFKPKVVGVVMGNKTSKQEGFSRTLSIRKSQKTTFQKINKKLERISKDIEKFNGNINDEKYTKIKQNVNEIIVDLEKISANVKDKHKDVYENILDKCNEQLNKLDAKVPSFTGVINAENAPPAVDSSLSQRSLVELKLVKIAVEDKKKVTIEETPSVSSVELPTEEKLQNNTVDRIDTMRKQIEYLEGEIHIYKQDNDQKLYGYIKENLNQIIIKLDNMETYGNVQIKHERKLALQRAQDCLRYLNSDPVPNKPNNQTEVDVEMHEDHARKITYTRPITFDLNTNEELKDELMQILNKRMEEASKEQSNGDEDTKPNPTKGPDDFENVENSETEEEFDFVDIADDSKSVPMLVTSL